MEVLSPAQARRVALSAQGFGARAAVPRGSAPPRTKTPGLPAVRKVLRATRLLQMDSVNVFERAHYLPAFSRLGPYDRSSVDRLAYERRELFEYWGHEASLLPVALHPLLRWRMARAEALDDGWGGPLQVMRDRPELVAEVLRRVQDEGPVGAGALRDGPRCSGDWWGWDDTKVALEYLFWSGKVSTSARRSFERLYDVTERVLPAEVLALPTPTREEAQRELVRLASVSLGVATLKDLRDYFRLRPAEGAAAVASLVEAGELLPVDVPGWRGPTYACPGLVVPRRVTATALLSPFDPLVWERSRTSRLFGFDYRIEIYVPAAKRVHGYYVLPFLHDEQLCARVDLKSDRAVGVLRVQAAWLEAGCDAGPTAEALAGELRRAAQWQGLTEVLVEPRGDLAPALATALLQP